VVPVAATKPWLLASNDEPLHHCLVAVSSIATPVAVMVVPAPEFDEAVPVIVPLQLAP
jgi:hypothetical protein